MCEKVCDYGGNCKECLDNNFLNDNFLNDVRIEMRKKFDMDLNENERVAVFIKDGIVENVETTGKVIVTIFELNKDGEILSQDEY